MPQTNTDVKYLNLHAPGCGFADYMRGLRDKGDTEWFDQFDPDGVEGTRPASEISVTSGDGVLCDTEAISVTVTSVDGGAGASPITRAAGARGVGGVESFYVISGDVAFEFEDREGLAAPGTWLQTPAFTPSELSFPDGAAARFLTVRTPRADGPE